MYQKIKMNMKPDMILRMIFLFFVACLSFNTFFYVRYGNHNAYTDTSQPVVKTGNEYLMKMSDVDYYFLDHLFQEPSLKPMISELIGKGSALLSYVAVLCNILFQAVLTIVFFLMLFSLLITLPDDLTLINQKVRLDD